MDNFVVTDDDRQTPSDNQSSSDDISSETTEILLPVYENGMSNIPVCSVTVDDRSSVPNLNIKHPCRSNDDDNNPFNDEKRIIIDEHVKVSHIDRSNLPGLQTDILLLRLDACSRRKSTGNVSITRTNKKISHNINGNLNNRQITSKQSTAQIRHISTAANIKQHSDQKIIASKPIVTRVSASNEPLKMKQKELHVSIKHIPIDSKQSS